MLALVSLWSSWYPRTEAVDGELVCAVLHVVKEGHLPQSVANYWMNVAIYLLVHGLECSCHPCNTLSLISTLNTHALGSCNVYAVVCDIGVW